MAPRDKAPKKYRNKWYIEGRHQNARVLRNANRNSRYRYKVLDFGSGDIKYFKGNQVRTSMNKYGRRTYKFKNIRGSRSFEKSLEAMRAYLKKMTFKRRKEYKARRA